MAGKGRGGEGRGGEGRGGEGRGGEGRGGEERGGEGQQKQSAVNGPELCVCACVCMCVCVCVCVWLTFLLALAVGSPASCEAMRWEVGPREKRSSLTPSCERSWSIAEAKDYEGGEGRFGRREGLRRWKEGRYEEGRFEEVEGRKI